MFRAKIIIQFKNGQILSYANKYLEEKTGTDNAGNVDVYNEQDEVIGQFDATTPLFKGYPELNYYYTGYGDDTYEDQTGKGKLKGDYDYLASQIGETGLVKFPEEDDTHADTTELVRDGIKKQFNTADIVSVEINEDWVPFPYGRESSYRVDKTKRHFIDFGEEKQTKLRCFDRGPNFNENFEREYEYIPTPVLKIEDNSLVVVNASEYDDTVTKEDEFGYTVYGIKNNKKSGVAFLAK